MRRSLPPKHPWGVLLIQLTARPWRRNARAWPLLLLAPLLLLTSCEQAIELDLPTGEEQIVVEGHIEPGQPPVVVLTRSVPVFAPLDAATLAGSLVHGARV